MLGAYIGGDVMKYQPLPVRETVAVSLRVDPLLDLIAAAGRPLALGGVVLPLLTSGMQNFTPAAIDGLSARLAVGSWAPAIDPAFGAWALSATFGVVALATAGLFLASIWSARIGILAGLLGTIIFALGASRMATGPGGGEDQIWLRMMEQGLIKDVALLGISLLVLAQSLARRRTEVFLRGLEPVGAKAQTKDYTYLDC
jgi:hypothetical protein